MTDVFNNVFDFNGKNKKWKKKLAILYLFIKKKLISK
jgi:hypothetical protein